MIDEKGNCFILYWAHLKFIFFNFVYSSILFSDESNQIIEKSSLKKIPMPTGVDKINYTHSDFQFNGNWTRLDPPISLFLFEDQNKSRVYWQCLHPKSQAEIYFKNKYYKGLSYVESILLEIQPWKLPINELRWGRYLSPYHTVVWIQWKGEYPINKLSFNGSWYDDMVFNESGLTFNRSKCSLSFLNPTSIRSGPLKSLFSGMKWFKFLFKKSILTTHEQKFKSLTQLDLGNDLSDQGWSIYETVIWNK